MRIWAISDLHLSLGGSKPMDVFGDHWRDHHLRIAAAWDAQIRPDDVILMPGDFSWSGKPAEVELDCAWLAARPGTKVLFKGNHDHWWPHSRSKLAAVLPRNALALKKNAVLFDTVGIYGVRGGDFAPLVRYGDTRTPAEIEATLVREEAELAASLADLQRQEGERGQPARLRICCFHYPPFPPGSRTSRFSPLLRGARHCLYGHLHLPVGETLVEGEHDGTRFRCVSCDVLDFQPVLIDEA